jgi:hypothetical protein
MKVRLDLKEVSMTTTSISRILRTAFPIIIVCGLLVSGTSAMAQSATAESHEGHCSNRTLSGDYGFTLEGIILAPNFQIRGVVLQHYDGNGNITQVDHVVNGMPPAQEWTPGTGTYTVNPDSTGAAVLHTPAEVKLHFVVAKHGTEIHQVVDADAVTTIGVKVQ